MGDCDDFAVERDVGTKIEVICVEVEILLG